MGWENIHGDHFGIDRIDRKDLWDGKTYVETISVLIELIAKTYRMGKNNSGATPPHASMDHHTPSMRITTQIQG